MPKVRIASRHLFRLCFFSICLVLAGCQTTNNVIGTGNLTLEKRVTDNFRNEYLKKPNAGFYFVSEDGRYARYNHCLDGAGKCAFGGSEFDALRSCERASQQRCYLFARGHEVVWQGEVNFAGSGWNKVSQNELLSMSGCRAMQSCDEPKYGALGGSSELPPIR